MRGKDELAQVGSPVGWPPRKEAGLLQSYLETSDQFWSTGGLYPGRLTMVLPQP